jgi:hypothetical protein
VAIYKQIVLTELLALHAKSEAALFCEVMFGFTSISTLYFCNKKPKWLTADNIGDNTVIS